MNKTEIDKKGKKSLFFHLSFLEDKPFEMVLDVKVNVQASKNCTIIPHSFNGMLTGLTSLKFMV